MNKQIIDLPDGTYEALWSGYNMIITSSDKNIPVGTTIGVKGINCKITVDVQDGNIKDYNNA